VYHFGSSATQACGGDHRKGRNYISGEHFSTNSAEFSFVSFLLRKKKRKIITRKELPQDAENFIVLCFGVSLRSSFSEGAAAI
jgi:hypothetical protein